MGLAPPVGFGQIGQSQLRPTSCHIAKGLRMAQKAEAVTQAWTSSRVLLTSRHPSPMESRWRPSTYTRCRGAPGGGAPLTGAGETCNTVGVSPALS